jgi:Protein of unknown function (DUF1064)
VSGGSKYGNVPTEYRGQVYDSRGEAAYARRLDLLRAAGAIRDWRRGGVWVLLDAPRTRDRITLRPDFEVVRNDGSLRAVDFKGCLTREFRLKAKLWRAVYPAVPLYVVRADGSEVPA